MAGEPGSAPGDPALTEFATAEFSESWVSHESVGALARSAEVVALVEVEGAETSDYFGVATTLSSVRVIRVFKGPVAVGDVLDVEEAGGFHRGRSKAQPGTFAAPVNVTWFGVPVMKPGERHLLFLSGPEQAALRPLAFHVENMFHGKMRVDASGRLAFPGDERLLAGELYRAHAAMRGRLLDTVAAEVSATTVAP